MCGAMPDGVCRGVGHMEWKGAKRRVCMSGRRKRLCGTHKGRIYVCVRGRRKRLCVEGAEGGRV